METERFYQPAHESDVCIKRTNTSDTRFLELIKLLDADLAISDGDEHAFYDQYNKLPGIKAVAVAEAQGQTISCGAFKPLDEATVEIKRMFTRHAFRGRGIAAKVLQELENWAAEAGYRRCVLETGLRQHAAIALYEKSGYSRIPNYGPYIGVDNSVCFEKILAP